MITFKQGTAMLNWLQVLQIFEQREHIGHSEKDRQACRTIQLAFENSYCVVSAWDGPQLVGFCRALSDGVRQSALYDLNVAPSYQNRGIGKGLLQAILNALPTGPTILYAVPGKEAYYQRQGFKKLRTAMALFPDEAKRITQGFITA